MTNYDASDDLPDFVTPHSQTSTMNTAALPRPPLNQILFGPPGTGKTYATIEAALEVLAPEFLLANLTNRIVGITPFRPYLTMLKSGTTCYVLTIFDSIPLPVGYAFGGCCRMSSSPIIPIKRLAVRQPRMIIALILIMRSPSGCTMTL